MFFRHAIPECVNMLIDKRKQKDKTITKLGTDMAVPDSQLEEVMALYNRMLQEQGLESAIWGHIGNNHLHVNILPNDGEEYKKGQQLYRQWAAYVTEKGGAVSAEHGVGKLKAGVLLVMYGRSTSGRCAGSSWPLTRSAGSTGAICSRRRRKRNEDHRVYQTSTFHQ